MPYPQEKISKATLVLSVTILIFIAGMLGMFMYRAEQDRLNAQTQCKDIALFSKAQSYTYKDFSCYVVINGNIHQVNL